MIDYLRELCTPAVATNLMIITNLYVAGLLMWTWRRHAKLERKCVDQEATIRQQALTIRQYEDRMKQQAAKVEPDGPPPDQPLSPDPPPIQPLSQDEPFPDELFQEINLQNSSEAAVCAGALATIAKLPSD